LVLGIRFQKFLPGVVRIRDIQHSGENFLFLIKSDSSLSQVKVAVTILLRGNFLNEKTAPHNISLNKTLLKLRNNIVCELLFRTKFFDLGTI